LKNNLKLQHRHGLANQEKKMCRLLVRNVSTIAKIKAPTALIAALTSEPKSDEGRESFMQMFSRFIEPAFHFSTPISGAPIQVDSHK
jgi:hypothetical protein